jgi:hypothetical protein
MLLHYQPVTEVSKLQYLLQFGVTYIDISSIKFLDIVLLEDTDYALCSLCIKTRDTSGTKNDCGGGMHHFDEFYV